MVSDIAVGVLLTLTTLATLVALGFATRYVVQHFFKYKSLASSHDHRRPRDSDNADVGVGIGVLDNDNDAVVIDVDPPTPPSAPLLSDVGGRSPHGEEDAGLQLARALYSRAPIASSTVPQDSSHHNHTHPFTCNACVVHLSSNESMMRHILIEHMGGIDDVLHADNASGGDNDDESEPKATSSARNVGSRLSPASVPRSKPDLNDEVAIHGGDELSDFERSDPEHDEPIRQTNTFPHDELTDRDDDELSDRDDDELNDHSNNALRANASARVLDDPPPYSTLTRRHTDEFESSLEVELVAGTGAGSKPFQCAKCGKCYTQKRNLTQHVKEKHGDQKFECEHCKKTFTRKNNMKVHMLTHTNGRRFACDLCDEKFIQKQHLAQHKLRKHEKPVVCPKGKCKTRFASSDEIPCHFAECHPGEEVRPPKIGNSVYSCPCCHALFKTAKSRDEHTSTECTENKGRQQSPVASATALQTSAKSRRVTRGVAHSRSPTPVRPTPLATPKSVTADFVSAQEDLAPSVALGDPKSAQSQRTSDDFSGDALPREAPSGSSVSLGAAHKTDSDTLSLPTLINNPQPASNESSKSGSGTEFLARIGFARVQELMRADTARKEEPSAASPAAASVASLYGGISAKDQLEYARRIASSNNASRQSVWRPSPHVLPAYAPPQLQFPGGFTLPPSFDAVNALNAQNASLQNHGLQQPGVHAPYPLNAYAHPVLHARNLAPNYLTHQMPGFAPGVPTPGEAHFHTIASVSPLLHGLSQHASQLAGHSPLKGTADGPSTRPSAHPRVQSTSLLPNEIPGGKTVNAHPYGNDVAVSTEGASSPGSSKPAGQVPKSSSKSPSSSSSKSSFSRSSNSRRHRDRSSEGARNASGERSRRRSFEGTCSASCSGGRSCGGSFEEACTVSYSGGRSRGGSFEGACTAGGGRSHRGRSSEGACNSSCSGGRSRGNSRSSDSSAAAPFVPLPSPTMDLLPVGDVDNFHEFDSESDFEREMLAISMPKVGRLLPLGGEEEEEEETTRPVEPAVVLGTDPLFGDDDEKAFSPRVEVTSLEGHASPPSSRRRQSSSSLRSRSGSRLRPVSPCASPDLSPSTKRSRVVPHCHPGDASQLLSPPTPRSRLTPQFQPRSISPPSPPPSPKRPRSSRSRSSSSVASPPLESSSRKRSLSSSSSLDSPQTRYRSPLSSTSPCRSQAGSPSPLLSQSPCRSQKMSTLSAALGFPQTRFRSPLSSRSRASPSSRSRKNSSSSAASPLSSPASPPQQRQFYSRISADHDGFDHISLLLAGNDRRAFDQLSGMGLDEDRLLAAILSTPNKNIDFYLDMLQAQDELREIF